MKNLRQVNILTGDNNSGKTSVLEVISTFRQPDIFRSWVDVSREERFSKNVIYIMPFAHTGARFFLNDILNNPELYQEILDVLKEFDPGIISINYDDGGKPRRGGYYKILTKENNKALPLDMYGDGMKKALLLMSAVIKAKNGILLLDEFETAIHTSAMDRVFKWILETCCKLNVQVFLTSHSEEAINKVLNCSEQLQKDMAVYTLYKDGEGNSVRRLDAKKGN